MSLSASRTQLAALTKDLLGAWQNTKEGWRDVKSQEFESRFIEPLEADVASALTAIEKLERVLAKVRSDLE